jgi:hypothetical protein
MDLSKLSAQVKGFQRRTTQKVLQQMGMADKTEDESHIRNTTTSVLAQLMYFMQHIFYM